ncbi:hypothetical protein BKA56DRAFT_236616 [Ilyonectria sp. MPI-CAGE-AT-0026]|nr:hypothetical protein BKA56DRAFT_236616 [Ilyonectria sp. MPI-CAGE-AT-0026]
MYRDSERGSYATQNIHTSNQTPHRIRARDTSKHTNAATGISLAAELSLPCLSPQHALAQPSIIISSNILSTTIHGWLRRPDQEAHSNHPFRRQQVLI